MSELLKPSFILVSLGGYLFLQDYEKLKKDLEDERKARKKLESTVQKSMQSSSPGVLPTANLNHNNHNSESNP